MRHVITRFRRLMALAAIAAVLIPNAACSSTDGGAVSPTTAAQDAGEPGTGADAPSGDNDDIQEDDMADVITITVNDTDFTAHVADNATARAFMARLPMTVTMDELNGNEKYHYLPDPLPSRPQRVSAIASGDLMLYGNDCIVLFYESFRTPYSYTRIGTVDDPDGLAEAAGTGPAGVRFDAAG